MPFMLQPEVKSRAAADVAVSVRDDDGAAAALDSFHRHLPLAKPEQGHHVLLLSSRRVVLIQFLWELMPAKSFQRPDIT
ncbi:sterol 3-beta-glucosyltransferase UGT80B1-like isoform X2 [Salvia splendens]|uniref:sterol 3-beta-glucosyltransferase UGT80B1-like isoform X2 n=1 Tax=Salvia splendens TaxID=180675 RepID=UPI001C26FE9F|nr:sterol 3-beta-glucosyltransferase UGT80B1-like isoform X2 [Salvia splendens]